MMAAHGTEPGAVIQSHQRCSPCLLKGRSCAVNRCWGSPWEMPPPATQPPGSAQHPGPCCHPISTHIPEIDSLCRDPSCSPDQHCPAGTALWTHPAAPLHPTAHWDTLLSQHPHLPHQDPTQQGQAIIPTPISWVPHQACRALLSIAVQELINKIMHAVAFLSRTRGQLYSSQGHRSPISTALWGKGTTGEGWEVPLHPQALPCSKSYPYCWQPGFPYAGQEPELRLRLR